MRTIPIGAPRWAMSRSNDPQETIDEERESLDAQAPPEEPSMRFVLEITDTRTKQTWQVQGSTVFTAIERLRATMARPELVLSGDTETDPDPWSGR